MDRETFKRLLATGPLLGDGGTGTSLVSGGAQVSTTIDALNLSDPSAVESVHRGFVEAGARFIESNTFGANRYRLREYGTAHLLQQINAEGVRLARSAGAELVGGSIGPLGVRLVPYGRVSAEEAQEAFREQISALADAGADILFIETQTDLAEAEQAVAAARAMCGLPVVVTFTFTRDDRTLLGENAATVARRLQELQVDAIGVNCAQGPAQVLRLITAIRGVVPDVPLCAKPNAGQPHRLAGRIMYQASPKYLADYAVRFRDAGAVLIGGCCGTGPEHIFAMGEALRRARIDPAHSETHDLSSVEETHPAEIRLYEASAPNELARALGAEGPVFVVEMTPPHSSSAARLVAAADTLRSAGAHAVSVADSPMARMRMSPWAACYLIQQEAMTATVLHFPTRGRNLLRIQGDLLASYALGIRNIFVCMGDPTSIGEYPQAGDRADVTPSGLIGLIKQGLNMGRDRLGASIGDATDFVVACAVDLGARNIDREAKVLHRKIVAGADFAYSQPLFSVEPLTAFRRRYEDLYGELRLPVLVGLLPTISQRHAEFLHNEVPGIAIPEAVLARMSASGKRPEKEGLQIAMETGQQILSSAAGLYLIPPFGRYHLAAELIERLGAAAGAA